MGPIVLNIDDDTGMRYARSRVLREAGIQVIEGCTGAEALTLAARHRPSLVILDVNLPDISGLEICRRLKSGFAAAPAVLHISATAITGADQALGLEVADSYLVEPLNPTVLVATVKAMLRAKAAEQAFREADERLRAAMEASGTGTFRREIATGEVEWDDNLRRLFGVPEGRLIRNVAEGLECVHPDDRARLEEAILRSNREGTDLEMEFRVTWPDGSVHWLHGRGKMFRDGSGAPSHVTGAFVDVTERKRTEQALREQAERFRVALKGTPIVVWHQDADLRYTWMYNPLPGFEQISFIGHTDEELFPDEQIHAFVAAKREVLASGTAIQKEMMVGIGGKVRWFEIILEPLRNGAGEVVGLTGAGVDITGRKHTEEALRRSNTLLEESNEDLQRFAYAASHDLQEPLRAISNFAGLLARRYKGKLDEQADQFLDFMLDGTARMRRLISDLLEYSKVVHAGPPQDEVDCSSALEWALGNLNRAIVETGAAVSRSELPRVRGDERLLIRLFQNLVSNALKYSKPGERPEVHISAREHGTDWVFSVADKGVGIEPRFHGRIFGIFQRLHGAEMPGTGIGLALCQRIVERHGGRIWVESEAGAGATFFFTIPRTPPAK